MRAAGKFRQDRIKQDRSIGKRSCSSQSFATEFVSIWPAASELLSDQDIADVGARYADLREFDMLTIGSVAQIS